MLFLIFFKLKNSDRELCQNIVGSGFLDTCRQVATVAVETMQPVLSQFENFLTY